MITTFDLCEEGLSVSDFEAESFVLVALHEQQIIKISTSNVVYAARSLIAKGKISNNQIRFSFKGKILQPNKDGRLEEWPTGFCDHIDNWLCDIISPLRARKKVQV